MSTFVAIPLRRQETRDKEQKEMCTRVSQKISSISLDSLPLLQVCGWTQLSAVPLPLLR